MVARRGHLLLITVCCY